MGKVERRRQGPAVGKYVSLDERFRSPALFEISTSSTLNTAFVTASTKYSCLFWS